MTDSHNVLHRVYATLKPEYHKIKRFLDHENIWLDISMTVLCGLIRILEQFICFGIMAASHNVLHRVQFTSKSKYYVINRFLDHENICLDT